MENTEFRAFADALADVEPDRLTMCRGWTVRDVVAHLVAGAFEVAKNLGAFNDGGLEAVPATTGFEERERPFRARPWDELCELLPQAQAEFTGQIDVALAREPAAATHWTGRLMPIAAFVTHARSEYALHRWDVVGDDATSMTLLSNADLTRHAVLVLSSALVTKAGCLDGRELRLGAQGEPDVVVSNAGLTFAPRAHAAHDICGDPAARLLMLWGRTPQPPTRLRSLTGRERLAHLRLLLAGY